MSRIRDKEKVKRYLYQNKGSRCGICYEPIYIKDLYTYRITIDHIKPIYDGGTDDYSNLQLAHHECNQRKGCDTNY